MIELIECMSCSPLNLHAFCVQLIDIQEARKAEAASQASYRSVPHQQQPSAESKPTSEGNEAGNGGEFSHCSFVEASPDANLLACCSFAHEAKGICIPVVAYLIARLQHL